MIINLYSFFNAQVDVDTVSYQKKLAKVIRADSAGVDIDIYGVNPDPTYYMMWQLEKDPQIKEKYFAWIKWAREKGFPLVYFIESSYDLDEEKIEDIADQHKLGDDVRYKVIYESKDGKKVYRIE